MSPKYIYIFGEIGHFHPKFLFLTGFLASNRQTLSCDEKQTTLNISCKMNLKYILFFGQMGHFHSKFPLSSWLEIVILFRGDVSLLILLDQWLCSVSCCRVLSRYSICSCQMELWRRDNTESCPFPWLILPVLVTSPSNTFCND